MSLYDSVFGPGQTAVSQSQYNQNAAAAQLGQTEYSMNAQRDKKYVQQAFNQALSNMNQNPYATQNWSNHSWVFNNQPCTLQEFADCIWPGESEDKMLFILTHSGPKSTG